MRRGHTLVVVLILLGSGLALSGIFTNRLVVSLEQRRQEELRT